MSETLGVVPDPPDVAHRGPGADDTGPLDVTPHAESFEEFFDREKGALFGALALVTRNRHEAEELTQDAFVRLLERWDRVGEMDDPRGYLYRTAMNTFRSRYRRAVTAAKRG
ncbi:MAG TPA: sigma factor, partial [Actinomycetota bacterium]|nr:sigma factor [Actinomycetota bacterium]